MWFVSLVIVSFTPGIVMLSHHGCHTPETTKSTATPTTMPTMMPSGRLLRGWFAERIPEQYRSAYARTDGLGVESVRARDLEAAGRSAFARRRADHREPYKPTTRGKNERFHQTLFRWLDKQSLAEALEQLQAQVDVFDLIYNTERPHQGLPGRVTPMTYETCGQGGLCSRSRATCPRAQPETDLTTSTMPTMTDTTPMGAS